VKLNVDENPRVPTDLKIEALPTFVVFRDGSEVHRFTGARTKDSFQAEIQRFAAAAA
jgi:thioredoxin-like negative regulator of GroEL